jgi:flagellar motility protein MotE (MotC chaperone)
MEKMRRAPTFSFIFFNDSIFELLQKREEEEQEELRLQQQEERIAMMEKEEEKLRLRHLNSAAS